jgi:8-oxo-dGTP pyrophosphatase MutT (NUDIX family)
VGEDLNRAPKTRVRAAAIVVKDDTLLLVLHKRGDKEYYLLPGGGVEQGESDEQALRRELLEETGLTIAPGKLLFETTSVYPDHSRRVVQRVYLCQASGEIAPSKDPRVAGAAYISRGSFKQVKFYPNIRAQILSAWEKGFAGDAVSFDVPWED